MSLESLSTSPVVLAVGWTLLHFLWQGMLIAASVALALFVLRHRSASVRYLLCCLGLVAMLVTPLITLVIELRHDALSSASLGLLSAFDPSLLSRTDGLTRVLPAFVGVWLVGAFLFQGRLFLHWLSARALRHREARPAPSAVQSMVAELADRLGVRRSVLALESGLARVPAVMGWLRPVVLLPSGVLTGLTPQQLRAVLAHELAHVARHDYLVNLAQGVIEALLFYHPATWWLGNRLRTLREYCCDDVSVELCGDAMCFARALSSLGELADELGTTALSSSATLGATGGSPMDRIRRLFGMPVAETQRPAVWAAPLALTIALSGTAALALPAPAGDEHEVPVKGRFVVRLHPQHDIVDLAESVDARSGEILARLREAGATDDMLMAVLMELNPTNERVLAAAEKTMRHEQQLQAKMAGKLDAARLEIDRAVAQGVLTEAEGKAKLETIERKVGAALRQANTVQHTGNLMRRKRFDAQSAAATLVLLEEKLSAASDPATREAIEAELQKLTQVIELHGKSGPFGLRHADNAEIIEEVAVDESRVSEFKQTINHLSQVGAELEAKLELIEAELVGASDASARAELEEVAQRVQVKLESVRTKQHGTMRHLEHVLHARQQAQSAGDLPFGHVEEHGGDGHLLEIISEVHEPHGNEFIEEHVASVEGGGDVSLIVVEEGGQHEVLLKIIKGEMAARGLDEVEIEAAVQRIHGQQQFLLNAQHAVEGEHLHRTHQVLLEAEHGKLIEKLRASGLTEEQIKAKLHGHRELQERTPRER